ncbi:MAG TPA: MFS transporter [Candidatus Acidoferrales bacterium]|nr:MFS transporter [Candidatus Acidoferrales bacterium]
MSTPNIPNLANSETESSRQPLRPGQIRGFVAAWGGWALDGMDSFIYALVLVPALRELLPRSGHSASIGEIGFYGGLLFALFLIGWGLAFLWGPVADKFGRVPTLMATILWYSAFTLASAASTRVWHLAIFRLLAGIGIGGEWAMGGTYVAEAWPEKRRAAAGAIMHTGYYFGVLLAGVANSWIGARYGWRAMFLVGGAPALLVALMRYGVEEPARWQQKVRIVRAWSLWRPFAELFSPEYRRRTLLNSFFMLVSIAGLWAGSVYVPAAVTALAEASHFSSGVAADLASEATILLSGATILGCLCAPVFANRFGRRGALGIYFFLMLISIAYTFGYAFYRPGGAAIEWFGYALFVLGFGGANFAVYTIWLPEQYPTECRASAFAFATSFARFAGAGITFLVGAGVAHFGTIGFPVALTALAFIPGMLLLPWGFETRGKPLPN